MRRDETSAQRMNRIRQQIWPDAQEDEVLWIEPIGSRHDALIYWRKEKLVATGTNVNSACFQGTLDEFEAKLSSTSYYPGTTYREDYEAALAFLRALP